MSSFFTVFWTSPHARLLAGGGCFLVGASFASLFATRWWLSYVLIAGFLTVFVVIVVRAQSWRNVFVLVLCFVLGMLRFIIALPVEDPDQLLAYAGRQAVLEGVVREEPDRRLDAARYVVEADMLVGQMQPVRGRLLIKMPLYPEYQYGDRLKISCRLARPEPTKDGFRYDRYLANQGIFVTCDRAKVEQLSSGNGSWLFTQLLRFKYFVAVRINAVWNEPKSSFMAGILYGSRAGLPPELTDLFNKTGVTHIIAVSGANISIIAVAVLSILFAIGLHRRQASWAVGAFIFTFVIFTGASASVVRAGIMGGIALLAKLVGRPIRISIVLMVTAVVMTLINPYVLMWDAGFQLSFLSTMGLIYISPLLMERVPTWRWPKPLAVLTENGLTTMSAIFATLPLMLFQFGRLSLVAPVVNILILWTIPYVMLFGFIATILGMIYVPVGIIAALPSVALMEYILRVVRWFGSRSFAAVEVSVPWWGMAAMYMLIVSMVGWYYRRRITT